MKQQQNVTAFIGRWQGITASELSTAQSFVIELCELLGVARPHATSDQDYMFERPVTFMHGNGSSSPGRIDCYRRGHFVLEAKKLKTGAHTKGFDDGLLRARTQGEGYARALPASEGRPPFVLVVDVGTVIEVFAEFSRTGGTYTPFPDPRSHRIMLADLADPAKIELLRLIWTDPDALDPALISAKVTREVSDHLALLARLLEEAGHASHDVAAYLSRCLFSMFAEDVGLLPEGSFLTLLTRHRDDPTTLQHMLRGLWADMDVGNFSGALAKKLLRFNGKLFKGAVAENYSLPLRIEEIDLLILAAKANWREVEPAIFGTLLERALDPAERHALGAHYTPRAYVERLVLPTVIAPLRAEWANAQAAALLLAHEAAQLEANPPETKTKKDYGALNKHNASVRLKWQDARQQVKDFLHRLCSLRVLDPACGSGNFLYVTLEHLKRLEGEALNQLAGLGDTQSALDLGRETVTLRQFLGIEVNERAATLAELVLWIGYLQWHIRSTGNSTVAEPVVHDYQNIENRDAVLAYDRREQNVDTEGVSLTRWDGVTMKTHPVTARQVPDDAAQVPQWKYVNPRQAAWPEADFIVGNPPYIGARTIRQALGGDYLEALRGAHPNVPENADFVMYWWDKAARLVCSGQTSRFGLITTNSLSQPFNRALLDNWLAKNLRLSFAIPNHPWVDNADGAAVRVAMTVGQVEINEGRLLQVVSETPMDDGEIQVELQEQVGLITPSLTVGMDVAGSPPLRANKGTSCVGYQLTGQGFRVSAEQATAFDPYFGTPKSRIRPLFTGSDITQQRGDSYAIDLYGLDAPEIRERYPAIYQWIFDNVKPERDHNNRKSLREKWWLFGEARSTFRPTLSGIGRAIATSLTAKHRTFIFVDERDICDSTTVMFALPDAYHLGVLSSRAHVLWALAAGGTLEDRPRYNKSLCFETYPFPGEDTGLTSDKASIIRRLGAQIDEHRKAQQLAYPELTLTALYNVLEKLRAEVQVPLTVKEKSIYEVGLVGVLKSLHDELDAAVLDAYGWADLHLPSNKDELLERLIALNARRFAEEVTGAVRWLRPDLQQAGGQAEQTALNIETTNESIEEVGELPINAVGVITRPWPFGLPEQIKAVAEVLSQSRAGLDLNSVAARFSGRGRWRERLPMLLETLEALGRARMGSDGRWLNTGL